MAGDRPREMRRRHADVSIHARTWRATRTIAAVSATYLQFQSTPAHGGRPGTPRLQNHVKSFNPRPHMAGDTFVSDQFAETHVSIHARTWRATAGHGGWRGGALFQSTPAHGGRRWTASASMYPCFNPRPHMAGDAKGFAVWPPVHCFNPRPHMAGDPALHHGRQLARNVSIHARTWRATATGASSPATSFNPRPHMAGDLRPRRSPLFRACFNPRPHMAGDRRRQLGASGFCFNPRPHMAGDHGSRPCWRCQLAFQSTPAHGGRPEGPQVLAVFDLVSIHARTWRATPARRSVCRHHIVSIHARTWRATSLSRSWSRHKSSFNPRPHMAGDHDYERQTCRSRNVSIHARTWRATLPGYQAELSLVFQSTPAHGGRPVISSPIPVFGVFQSTPAHGGRPTAKRDRAALLRFQSTPAHGGRPQPPAEHRPDRIVSIHARTWRATGQTSRTIIADVFQSTPAHGGRPVATVIANTGGCFNPRPHMAGDHEAGRRVLPAVAVSIHARTWRATDVFKVPSTLLKTFQSTPAHGGRPTRRMRA